MVIISAGLKMVDTNTRELIDMSRPPGTKNKPKGDDFSPEDLTTIENDAKPERSREKPLDGKMGKTEIQRGLCTAYNMFHRFLHDDVRFTPSDFTEEADGLMELVNRSARWRIIFRLLGPLNAVGAMWEKVEGTVYRAKSRRQGQEPEPIQQQPVGVNGNFSGEPRPIFK
ncbi:MAG: hypothetical protein ACYCSN_13505 [Acidobacteriaceae bacterium]